MEIHGKLAFLTAKYYNERSHCVLFGGWFFLIVVVSMTCNALDLGFGPLLYHDLCPVFVWIPGRLLRQGMERVQNVQAFRGSREGLYYG